MTEHTTGSPLGECEADSVTHDGTLTTVRPVGPSQLHRPYKTPLAPSNGQGELSLHIQSKPAQCHWCSSSLKALHDRHLVKLGFLTHLP